MMKRKYVTLLPMFVTSVTFDTVTHAFVPNVRGMTIQHYNPIGIHSFVSSQQQLFAESESKYTTINDDVSTMENLINKKTTASTQPTPVLIDAVRYVLGDDFTIGSTSLSNSSATIALAAILATSSTLLLPMNADAAMSGGRMGGSFSSPSSRSMPSRSSSSYYGGGGGGRSYNYYSRPSSTIVAPIFVPSPFSPVVPFYGYGGGGAGVISYSRGPSFFDLLFFGGIGLFLLNTLTQVARSGTDSGSDTSSFLPWTSGASTTSALGTGSSVVQISVALNVPNRDDPNSILNVLDRLAQTSKTDSRLGVQQLTSQVAIELLRRKSSFSSGLAQAKHYDNNNKAQREYNRVSVQERSKFEKELVSKYGGVDYNQQISPSRGGSGTSTSSTMAVVTILLNIAGDTTANGITNPIRSTKDLEKALQRIASDVIIEDCLTSAEILWTPEDRSESLSLRDVIADYPELISV